MNRNFHLSLLLLSILALSCGKNHVAPDPSLDPACGSGQVLKQAVNRNGSILFNKLDSTYAIYYHEPGTYDSVDLGYTCNLPENMKETGLKVRFSGEYRKNPLPQSFAGSTNYYLRLIKIERL